jgi:hypothetical protein
MSACPPPPPPGNEGGTPGYWKQSQHLDSCFGFAPSQKYEAVFGVNVPGDPTRVPGPGGPRGGINALERHRERHHRADQERVRELQRTRLSAELSGNGASAGEAERDVGWLRERSSGEVTSRLDLSFTSKRGVRGRAPRSPPPMRRPSGARSRRSPAWPLAGGAPATPSARCVRFAGRCWGRGRALAQRGGSNRAGGSAQGAHVADETAAIVR